MFAAFIVIALFIAVCYLSDKHKQRVPTLRWAIERRRYMVQYETVFGLWLPYRGGGAFHEQHQVEEWIEKEIERLEEELKGMIGEPRRPFEKGKKSVIATP